MAAWVPMPPLVPQTVLLPTWEGSGEGSTSLDLSFALGDPSQYRCSGGTDQMIGM